MGMEGHFAHEYRSNPLPEKRLGLSLFYT